MNYGCYDVYPYFLGNVGLIAIIFFVAYFIALFMFFAEIYFENKTLNKYVEIWNYYYRIFVWNVTLLIGLAGSLYLWYFIMFSFWHETRNSNTGVNIILNLFIFRN